MAQSDAQADGISRSKSKSSAKSSPVVIGIVMGSRSDWPTLEHAAQTLEALGVAFETRVVSAHRTPDLLFQYAETAADRGLRAIIAGAGGAAHLPGMLAAKTWLPVLGVPVESKALSGLDSLFSIVQMPAGIPVATFAIGRSGAVNAALYAAAMLGTTDAALRGRLEAWRARQTEDVLAHPDPAKAAASAAAGKSPERSKPSAPSVGKSAAGKTAARSAAKSSVKTRGR